MNTCKHDHTKLLSDDHSYQCTDCGALNMRDSGWIDWRVIPPAPATPATAQDVAPLETKEEAPKEEVHSRATHHPLKHGHHK